MKKKLSVLTLLMALVTTSVWAFPWFFGNDEATLIPSKIGSSTQGGEIEFAAGSALLLKDLVGVGSNVTAPVTTLDVDGAISSSNVGVILKNLVEDPGFEDGVADVTCTTGTCVSESTDFLIGKQGLEISLTAQSANVSQCYDNTPSARWDNVATTVSAHIRTALTSVEFCWYDGTNDEVCVDVSSDDNFHEYIAHYTPANGDDLCWRVKSTSETGNIYVDNVYIGPQIPTVSDNLAAPERHEIAGNQTISTSTTTIIDYDQAIINGGQVTTGAAWKFTAVKAGVYNVYASVIWASTATDADSNLKLYKNGALYSTISNDTNKKKDTTNTTYQQGGGTTIELEAGDYIDVRATHIAGGTLDIVDSSETYIDIYMVKGEGEKLVTPTNSASPVRATTNANQTISNATITQVNYNGETFDASNLWDGNDFTAPNSGTFFVSGSVYWAASTANFDSSMYLYKNGSTFSRIGELTSKDVDADSDTLLLRGWTTVQLDKGDTVSIRVEQSSGGNLDITTSDRNNVNIYQIDRNPLSASLEKVVVYKENTTGDALNTGTFTELQYDASGGKDIDTNSAWNGSEFTAPRDMKVEVKASIQFQSAAWSAGTFAEVLVDLNQNGDSLGATYISLDRTYTDGSSIEITANGSAIIEVSSGDVLRIKGRQTSGSTRNRSTDGAFNMVSFTEIK